MKYSLFFQIIFLLSLPWLSDAGDIREGYWVGIGVKETNSSFTSQIEEWHFENGILEFKKYNHELEPSPFSGKGTYEIAGNRLVLSDESWDSDISFPIIIEKDRIILSIGEMGSKVYLYYNGKKPGFPASAWEEELSEGIYSTDRPELLFRSNEVEFWDFASFYSEKKIAKCHHNYNIFQFGEHHFIVFEQLQPFKILRKENDAFFLELISDEREPLVFTPTEHISAKLDMDALAGEWKWKETREKPDNIRNPYTISIGYETHHLKIERDGFIQWMTEYYYEEINIPGKIRPKDPHVIPGKVKAFQNDSPYKKERNQKTPFIKISPSGRLVLFESFPFSTPSDAQGQTAPFFNQIAMLQFVEKSDVKILLKKPYSGGNYITFTRILD